MKNKYSLYSYRGPIWDHFYSILLEERWQSETIASSKEKAISNLKYQYRKERKLPIDYLLNLDEYRLIESELVLEDEDEKSPDFDQDVVVSEDKDETCCVSQLTLF